MATCKFNQNDVGSEAPFMRETHDMLQHCHGMEAPRHPVLPVPPHMRRQMLHIAFEDKDTAVFQEAFGDMDTAKAAMDILCGAPPEIQILALQILHMIEKGES